jgi:hypothetical protein
MAVRDDKRRHRRRGMIHVIATQLGDKERSGDALDEWIRGNFDSWTHPAENLWLVEGPYDSGQIHTALTALLAPGDRLVIVKAGTEAAWHGVSADAARWFADLFPASFDEPASEESEEAPT